MAADFFNIYIADDDDDDCMLFADVLLELEKPTKLTTASNGAELIDRIRSANNGADFPHLLFLDFNMPIKNGLQSLIEIKQDAALRRIPVILYSTSAQNEAVESAYANGASLYLKKPDSFSKMKQVLQDILSIDWYAGFPQPSKDQFLIDI